MRWTIRTRLTLLNTLALAVLLAGFAALIYALLARAIHESVDGKLAESWRQLERVPGMAADPAWLRRWIAESWERDEVAIALHGAGGELLARTSGSAGDAVSEPPVAALAEPHFHTTRLNGGRRRVMTARLPDAPVPATVVLAADLAEADQRLAQLRTVLFTAVPATLLAAALIAYVLAGRALAPVAALERAARAITAESLDHRLPIANAHDELGRLTATINSMVARLERSFAEMRRFTADASHELRTPLTVLRTEVEVALARPLDEVEGRRVLASVLEECERLTRLTDQLLTLARHDAGVAAVRRQPVDLAVLAASVTDILRPLAESKGLLLSVQSAPGDPAIRGDPDQLRQVFVNVLDNALKHTAAGSVTVTIEPAELEVSVRVRDTGEGIAAEHLPHVFERFYRADPARARGGSGLGLSISRGLVATHGGRIEVRSDLGRGTECVVTLPR